LEKWRRNHLIGEFLRIEKDPGASNPELSAAKKRMRKRETGVWGGAVKTEMAVSMGNWGTKRKMQEKEGVYLLIEVGCLNVTRSREGEVRAGKGCSHRKAFNR